MSDHDLDKYLARSEIIAIPASITASTNLVIIIACALSALNMDAKLKEELKDSGIEQAIKNNDVAQINALFTQNENQNGLLHRIYLESLRRETMLKTGDHLSLETIQTRYTSHPIKIGNDCEIPAKSTIMFLRGSIRFNVNLWENPNSFDPNRFKINPDLAKYAQSIFSEGTKRTSI